MSENYNKKRSIEYMKNNMKNRNVSTVYTFPIKPLSIISELVKKQNYILLKQITDDKFINDDEKELFINKYHNVSYYTPEQINNENKEDLQKYI